MMWMGDMNISKIERTKACMVQINDSVYESIVNDMMPGMLVSQDVLNVCLMQSSLEMHMKYNK